VGEEVVVQDRHWPGINKEGGVAFVKAVHEDGTLDVKLILSGSTYKRLEPMYATPNKAVAPMKVATPKATAKAAARPKKVTPKKGVPSSPGNIVHSSTTSVVAEEASRDDTPREMMEHDDDGTEAPPTGLAAVLMMPVKFALFFGARKFRVHRVGGANSRARA
jgi:hypothetical protein